MEPTSTQLPMPIRAFFFLLFIIPLLTPLKADAAATNAGGTIDLSGYDFSSRGPVALSGEWEYFPGTYITGETEYRRARRAGFFSMPGQWKGICSGPDFGSFVIKVRLPDSPVPLALDVGEVDSCYQILLDWKEIGKVGKIAARRDEAVPEWRSEMFILGSVKGEAVLVMNAASFHHARGGIQRAPLLGSVSAIARMRQARRSFEMFLFGSIFIMALYQFILFLSKRSDPAPLYFSLYCFFISAYLLTTGEMILLDFFPSIPWSVFVATIYLTLYICPVFFLSYLKELFPRESSRRFRLGATIFLLIMAAMVILLPARFYSMTLGLFHIAIAIISVGALWMIFRAARSRKEGAIPLLVGISVLFLSVMNDVLYYQGVLGTGNLAPAGVLVLILTHGFAVSRRVIRGVRKRDEQGGINLLSHDQQERLDRAVAYICGHYTQAISREGLAALLDMHPDTLSRLFRQHTGMKMGEMINALRIDEAKRALAESDRTVVDIAMAVGFENLRTFNRVFKEISGTSPMEYRKNYMDKF